MTYLPMNNSSQQIASYAVNFAHVLFGYGLFYMAYTVQIAFPVGLKMAEIQTKPHFKLTTL